MKSKLLITLLAIVSASISTQGQGLENIIVEKYYISNANDATVNSVGGVLPVGSVTYRIYVDMQPGYIFQSAYGDANHECRIETTTLFFNNEDRGSVNPTFNFNYCGDNTVMLDSWLSVGGACSGRLGILKSEDDGVGTVTNNDAVLQNNDPAMGIPLTVQDGLIAGTPSAVTAVGISNEIMVFDAQNDGTNGPVFSTNNGAWASLAGATGPHPALNQVLIAQITTDGTLSFNLNVQIRNQSTLAVENYVASNPVGTEVQFAGLSYTSSGSVLNELNNIASPSFSIYPVPANDYLTAAMMSVSGSSETTLEITDVLGNIVSRQTLSGAPGVYTSNMDISKIPAGIYAVSCFIDNKVITRKLIKN